MFHPPPKLGRRGHLLNQRANKNWIRFLNIIFKLERTSYISNEQTQFFNERIYNINR